MGRKERRLQERLKRERDYGYELQARAQEHKVVQDLLSDAEDYVKHHVTGQMYTAMAIVLRRPPYRWSAEKTMRYVEQVAAIINDLNELRTHDSDLVTEGEKWGIRVRWNASHKYITEIGVYEE